MIRNTPPPPPPEACARHCTHTQTHSLSHTHTHTLSHTHTHTHTHSLSHTHTHTHTHTLSLTHTHTHTHTHTLSLTHTHTHTHTRTHTHTHTHTLRAVKQRIKCQTHWQEGGGVLSLSTEDWREWVIYESMNEWCIYIALYCVLLYTQSALQSCVCVCVCVWGGGERGSLLNHHQCATSTWMMRRLPQNNVASVRNLVFTDITAVRVLNAPYTSVIDTFNIKLWLNLSVIHI